MLYGGKFSVSSTRSVSGLFCARALLMNNNEALARTTSRRLIMSGYRNPWRAQECLGRAMLSTGLYALAHDDAAMRHVGLGFLHGVFAEVENTRCQHRAGVPFEDAIGQMLQVADTAGSDHRNAQRIADGAGDAEIEAVFHAVLIHAGQEDFAGTEAFHFLRPLDCIEAGRLAPAVGEDLPARGFARAGNLLGVDRDNDALRAEMLRGFTYELRVEHGSGVDRHLVRASIEQ